MTILRISLLFSLICAASFTFSSNYPTNAEIQKEFNHKSEILEEYNHKTEQLFDLLLSKRNLEAQSNNEKIIAITSGIVGAVTTYAGLLVLAFSLLPKGNLYYLCYTPLVAGSLAAYSFARKSRKHTKEANSIIYQIEQLKISLETLKDRLEETQTSES